MQYLGRDLAYYMKQLRRFTLKTILMLAESTVTNLENIHSRGVVHRDLKPENILLGRDMDQSQVYLVDFGISKAYKDAYGRHMYPNKIIVVPSAIKNRSSGPLVMPPSLPIKGSNYRGKTISSP
jgi:serine/threonine protein kinase